jgi:non-ribosomal peptide synthetase component F
MPADDTATTVITPICGIAASMRPGMISEGRVHERNHKAMSERHRVGDGSARSDLHHSALYGSQDPSLFRDEVLAEIFGGTALRRASHPAFVSPRQRLTYAEVDSASDQIARGLIREGIGPGDVVGLWLPRGIELLLCQIAITKAGAAWLPFDAETPAARIAACLTDAKAKGLLTAENARAGVAQIEFPLWTAAELNDATDTQPLPRRAPGLTPECPAYLIYTSGSTGSPKGIVVSHRNICHYLRATNLTFGIRAEDVVFQGASAAFDLSVEEIWVPLLVGATLRVATLRRSATQSV